MPTKNSFDRNFFSWLQSSTLRKQETHISIPGDSIINLGKNRLGYEKISITMILVMNFVKFALFKFNFNFKTDNKYN